MFMSWKNRFINQWARISQSNDKFGPFFSVRMEEAKNRKGEVLIKIQIFLYSTLTFLHELTHSH